MFVFQIKWRKDKGVEGRRGRGGQRRREAGEADGVASPLGFFKSPELSPLPFLTSAVSQRHFPRPN
jgi:hypothetical protein